MEPGQSNRFKFLNRSDYEKRLFLERALKICHKVIAKKNFEIGILTSERDEAVYNLDEVKEQKKHLQQKLSQKLY